MKIPSIRILRREDFRLLHELDLYTSLLWTRSWQGVGEFEFRVPLALGSDVLHEGSIIMLDNDGHRAGIVRSVQIDSGENGIVTTVQGQSLDGLAAQRYTVPSGDPLNGGYDNVPAITSAGESPSPIPAETILKTYVKRHMSYFTDIQRGFLNLHTWDDYGRGMKTVWMSRYEPLDSVLQKIAEYTDIGWEFYIHDILETYIFFDVIPGVDRTAGQTQNSRVIFSMDYENINTLTYSHDVNSYKNLAYAGGVGDGADRAVLAVTNEEAIPTGYDRFETFVDCGQLEMTETETALSLREEGKHKLLDYPKNESLTAAIAPSSSFLYRKDWDLGDLVTIVDKASGVTADRRISQVTERYEADSYGIDVTFGTPPKHIDRAVRSLKNTVR